MRILVSDDHPSFLQLLVTSIKERTEHEVVTTDNGIKALELALAPPRPDVLILDWIMPGMTGTQVCRLVRGTPIDPQPYVLFVTARCRREELLECLASGADDLITKPFAPDVLISRLELAERRFSMCQQSVGMDRALRSAQDEGNGELVVRSGKLAGRILFCDGKVAWVQLADSFGSLLDAMAPETGLDAEAAQEIVAECRRTGRGLGATLAAWGLVNGDQLRQLAQAWLKKKLSSLRSLEQPQFLFLPGPQRCSPELLFDLDELLEPQSAPVPQIDRTNLVLSEIRPASRPSMIPAAGWSSAFLPTKHDDASIETLLSRCMDGDGVLAAVAINRLTGVCLDRAGVELDPDIVWAKLGMINSIFRREPVEDAHVSTSEHLHLMALQPGRSDILFYCLVDSAQTSLASARLALREALRASEGLDGTRIGEG